MRATLVRASQYLTEFAPELTFTSPPDDCKIKFNDAKDTEAHMLLSKTTTRHFLHEIVLHLGGTFV